jgi:hypothetical protein
MALRSCRVTLEDFDDVGHTVEVTAATLYEAVAQALVTLRGNEWVAGIRQGTVTVSVSDVRVEHKVELSEFLKWLERTNGSPRDVFQRQRLRSILGMPVSK